MFIFLARSTSKMCLTLFQQVKKAFLDYKKQKFQKVEKSGFFQRGQSMVLVKNLKFFHVSIFGKTNQRNVFDVILESQKSFLDYEKQKVKKVEKSGFFQRGQAMVLVKNLKFFHVFIFEKTNHQNVFDVILASQNTFLDYKKQKLKKVEKSGFFERG